MTVADDLYSRIYPILEKVANDVTEAALKKFDIVASTFSKLDVTKSQLSEERDKKSESLKSIADDLKNKLDDLKNKDNTNTNADNNEVDTKDTKDEQKTEQLKQRSKLNQFEDKISSRIDQLNENIQESTETSEQISADTAEIIEQKEKLDVKRHSILVKDFASIKKDIKDRESRIKKAFKSILIAGIIILYKDFIWAELKRLWSRVAPVFGKIDSWIERNYPGFHRAFHSVVDWIATSGKWIVDTAIPAISRELAKLGTVLQNIPFFKENLKREFQRVPTTSTFNEEDSKKLSKFYGAHSTRQLMKKDEEGKITNPDQVIIEPITGKKVHMMPADLERIYRNYDAVGIVHRRDSKLKEFEEIFNTAQDEAKPKEVPLEVGSAQLRQRKQDIDYQKSLIGTSEGVVFQQLHDVAPENMSLTPIPEGKRWEGYATNPMVGTTQYEQESLSGFAAQSAKNKYDPERYSAPITTTTNNSVIIFNLSENGEPSHTM